MKKTIGVFCIGFLAFMLTTSTTCSNEQKSGNSPVSKDAEKELAFDGKGIEFIKGDLDKAKKQAAKEGKLIFVDCYTDWCGPCKRMAGTTFMDPEVASFFNENFINLKVEMEKDEVGPEMAKLYKVAAYPTLLIIDSEGNLKKQTIGFQDKGRLMSFVRNI